MVLYLLAEVMRLWMNSFIVINQMKGRKQLLFYGAASFAI